jgi:hypothetical protein
MAVITPTVAEMRLLVRDPAASALPFSDNLVYGEEAGLPQGQTLGASTSTLFTLANKPIVAGSIYVTVGTSYRQTVAAAGVTPDYINGLLSFASAPSSVPLIDYNFNFFQDSDYQEFINQGLRFLGFPGNSTQTLDELLAPALYEAAKHWFYKARSTTYANRYKSNGGGLGQEVDVVTANFKKLADEALADAKQMREDYYTRQSQNRAPSSHFFNYGVSPITPRH